jgi:predicted dehydrogenase
LDRFRAFADRGWFELAPAFGYGGIQGRRSDGKWTAFPPMDQFAAEMDDFAQCILNNQPTKGSRRGRSARPDNHDGDLRSRQNRQVHQPDVTSCCAPFGGFHIICMS